MTLPFEDFGAGSPLVAIHGSPGNGKSWRSAGAALAERFRIFAPTLSGHGDDEARHDDVGGAAKPTETVDHAAAVEQVIEGVGSPVVLAGHSYGGNVALAIALRERVPLDRLILFEPVILATLPVLGEAPAYGDAKTVFDRYIRSHEGGDHRAVATMIDFWFGPGAFDHIPEPMQSYFEDRAAVNVRDVKAAFRESYSLASLGALALPTLVAFGTKSPPVTATLARGLGEAIVDGTAVAIEGATHAMLATHSTQVAALIADFVPH